MSYIPKYFKVQELVDPEIYAVLGDKALKLLDERSLRAIDMLREEFGPVIINNWHAGGVYKESGLRRVNTKTGAERSQHKEGGAFDLKFALVSVKDVHAAIRANPNKYPIRRIEDIAATPTWLHIDQAGSGSVTKVFKP